MNVLVDREVRRMTRTFMQDFIRLRDAKGLTNSEIARRLEVTPQAIDNYIVRLNPKPQTVEKIAKAMGVKPGEFACYLGEKVKQAVIAGNIARARTLLDKYNAW